MFKLIGKLIKFMIIAVILLVVLVSCVGAMGKKKHEEPKIEEQYVETSEPVEQEEEEIVIEEEVEPEVEVDVEQEKETVPEDGIRPEFRKSMEDYEAFFDEYIKFMEDFKKDSSSLTMITKYADFLAKYTQAMTELDNINEDELSPAEDKLFLETHLRISNKLSQIAIDY